MQVQWLVRWIVAFSPRLHCRHLQTTVATHSGFCDHSDCPSTSELQLLQHGSECLAYLVYLKVPGSSNQKLDASPVPCRGLVSSHVFILEAFCLNLLQRIRPFTSTRRQATICSRSSASFMSCWLVSWSWQIDRSQICTKDRLPRLLLSLAECAVEVAKSVEGIERVSRSFDLGSRRQVILPTDLPRYDSQDWSVLKL